MKQYLTQPLIILLLLLQAGYSAGDDLQKAKDCLAQDKVLVYIKKTDKLQCIEKSKSQVSIDGNGVYSETTSTQTEVKQTNSNNVHIDNSTTTNIDNSKVLSDNTFSLFEITTRTYSEYMGYEPALYLDGTVTGTFDRATQAYAGIHLGVYDNIYIIGGYGFYSNPGDEFDDPAVSSSGKFINYGVSYHILRHNTLVSVDVYMREMLSQKHKCKESSCSESELENIDLSTGFIMVNWAKFAGSRRSGYEFGMGLGEDLFVFKAGLKFRFL